MIKRRNIIYEIELKIMKNKRTKIFDDYKYPSKYKHCEGKEIYLSEMNFCSYQRNKYAIIVWGPDCYTDIPHIHIIDIKTFGNVINTAYSIIDGKPIIKHGSIINDKLPNKILPTINRMIQYSNRQDMIITMWNCFNKQNRINKKNYKIPKLSNF